MTRFLIILKSFVRGMGGIGETYAATINISCGGRISLQCEPWVYAIGHLFERLPVLKLKLLPALGNVELQTINRRSPSHYFEELFKFE